MRLSWLLLLAVSWLSCREQVELSELTSSERGGAATSSASDTCASVGPDSAGASARRAEASPDPPIVTCPARNRPARCTLGGDAALGLRIVGTLLTPAGALRDAELDLDAAGNIACVACDCGDAHGALVIDCPSVVVSPGLVNLHDHLGYAGTPPLSHPDELYQHRNDWRLGENGHQALRYAGGASAAQVLAHELRMVLGGTTSIVGGGGRRGLLRNLELKGRDEGLLAGPIRAETFPLDDARGDVDSATCSFGRRPDSAESAASVSAYLAHLGEGTNQRAEDELRCALGNLDLIQENGAIVHAMALSRADATELRRRGASVIWSPRSNLDLYGRTAPVGLLSSLGVHLALGTDWLASGSMNQLRELECARRYSEHVLGGYFGAFELWRMVTSDAAWALDLPGRFAELKPGLVGDLALFTEQAEGPYESVVAARPQDVMLVLRQGAPLYGDAQLVSAFPNGRDCEPLDVCASARRVCSLETGKDLAELRAAGEAVYPLFSCEAPPSEPRCEPLVERECPAGESDCGAPPPGPAWDEADADADGVPDISDDCPKSFDPQQRDRDRDGRGDACDPCPSFNPGLLPCPISIAGLRAPASRLPPRSAVTLSSVQVTALRLEGSQGYYIEDGDHAAYSGIFVYTGDEKPKVEMGDVVTLSGYFDSYQETDELYDTELLARSASGTDYPPLLTSPAELGDAAPKAAGFASLLVRLEHAVVDSSNPDAPSDYDETGLEGELRVDDLLLPELDNQYSAATVFRTITGIAGFSFGHRKLYPRSPADVELD